MQTMSCDALRARNEKLIKDNDEYKQKIAASERLFVSFKWI